MADELQIYGVIAEVEHEDADPQLKVDGLVAEVEYEDPDPHLRISGIVIEVEYDPNLSITVPVSCQDIGVESLTVTPFYEYKRKFPVFDSNRQFETQQGRMKFPWLT